MTRYVTLGWFCLAATIAYVCRNSIGVAESTIRGDLGLSENEMGWVMALFFLPYACSQVPTGWLANRFGSRRSIPLFSVVWSLATAAMGLANGMVVLIATRMANGVAQAGLFPATTNSLGRWFPPDRRAVASGTLASFMSIGGVIGSVLTGLLIPRYGWRITFAAYGVLGIIWAIGFYAWFRDDPADHPQVGQDELHRIRKGGPKPVDSAPGDIGGPDRGRLTAWWTVAAMLSSTATWLICGQQFCRAAGQIFFSSWFATYLQETRGVTVADSGWLNSLPILGIVFGNLIGGGVSDGVLTVTGSRRWARCGVASTCMLLCAALVLLAYKIENPLLAVLTITAGTFCASVGGPCGYTITIDMGGRQIATFFGLMNMIGNLGAFSFVMAAPVIKNTAGWGSLLLVFSGLYFGAFLCWLLLNPRGDIFDHALIKPPPYSEK